MSCAENAHCHPLRVPQACENLRGGRRTHTAKPWPRTTSSWNLTVFYPKYPCYSRLRHLPKITVLHDFTAKLRHLPWLFMYHPFSLRSKWLLRFVKGFQFWIGLGSPELVCTLHALSSKLLQFEDCQQLLLTSAEAAAWQECTEVKVGSLPTINSGSCELEVYWCNCSPLQHQHSQGSPDNGPNTLAGAAQTPKEWDN